MKFVTLIPFPVFVYGVVLLAAAYFGGLPAFVFAALVLLVMVCVSPI